MPHDMPSRHERKAYRRWVNKGCPPKRLGVPFEDDTALVGKDMGGDLSCLVTTGRRWLSVEKHLGRKTPELPEGCWVVSVDSVGRDDASLETFDTLEEAIEDARERLGANTFIPHKDYFKVFHLVAYGSASGTRY